MQAGKYLGYIVQYIANSCPWFRRYREFFTILYGSIWPIFHQELVPGNSQTVSSTQGFFFCPLIYTLHLKKLESEEVILDASVPWYLRSVLAGVWLQILPELSFPVCFDPCSPPPHQTMATCNLCQIWHVDSVMVNCCQTNPNHHMQKSTPTSKPSKEYKTLQDP